MLKEFPYSQKEADFAAGMGVTSFIENTKKALEVEALGPKEMEVDAE